MNHEHLQLLVIRVMPYGKFGLLFVMCFALASWRENLLSVAHDD
ncbi:MAG: hypothetical protein AAB241_00765 [Pseudomonadota bacterium]